MRKRCKVVTSSLVALARGVEWASVVLVAVWIVDVVGGLNGVYDDNRRLARLDSAAEPPKLQA